MPVAADPGGRRPAVVGRVLLGIMAVAATGGWALVRGGVTRRAPAGLPDAGPLTAWGLPAARFAVDVTAAGCVGFLLTALVLAPAVGDLARRIAAGWGAIWAVAAGAELVFTHSDILGVALPAALGQGFGHSLATFPQQQALLAQVVLALLAAACAVRFPRPAAAAALGAVLIPLVTGHSGTAPHALAVPTLMVHVAAATVWTGGLLALIWLSRRGPGHLAPAADRFSGLAAVCFLTIAASGVANALLRLHGPGDLTGTAYGQLLIVKAAAIAGLGLFGLRHRRATLPRLRSGGTCSADRLAPAAAAAFRRLAAIEAVVLMATFAVAVALARTAPPGT